LDNMHLGIFTPGGRQLVLNADRQVFVFDAASGKELRHWPLDGGFTIGRAVSPDGKLLLTSAWGKTVQTRLTNGTVQNSSSMNHPVSIHELETGRLRKTIVLPEQGAGPVAFSADGNWFAVASSRPGNHLRVFDVSGTEVWAVEGFPSIVRSL